VLRSPLDCSVQMSAKAPVLPAKPMRDDLFYLSHITFKVESTLFRVPRYVFEDSSDVIRDMFLFPSGTQAAEGLNDENPITLQETSSWDFKQLLRALFCRTDIEGFTSRGTPPTTFDEWVAVIKLTHRWEMTALYQFAVKQAQRLPNVDPVEKLALARTYDIHDWVRPAVYDILRREESSQPLSQKDVAKLGLDVVLELVRTRERLAGVYKRCHAGMSDGNINAKLTDGLRALCLARKPGLPMEELASGAID